MAHDAAGVISGSAVVGSAVVSRIEAAVQAPAGARPLELTELTRFVGEMKQATRRQQAVNTARAELLIVSGQVPRERAEGRHRALLVATRGRDEEPWSWGLFASPTFVRLASQGG